MGISYKQDYGSQLTDFGLNIYGFGGGGYGKGATGTGSTGTGSAMGAALGGAAILGGAALKTQMDYDKFKDTPTNPPVKPPIEQPKIEENTPIIEDKTDENLGTTTVSPMDTSFDPYAWAKAMRDEEWAREDALRSHIEEREDNAYSRAIEDLRRSGVNINLLGNITPAGSGGGITNQTGSMDYTMSAAEYNKKMELLMQEIEQNFKGDENEKDRFTDLIRTLIMGGIMFSK